MQMQIASTEVMLAYAREGRAGLTNVGALFGIMCGGPLSKKQQKNALIYLLIYLTLKCPSIVKLNLKI